MSSKWLSTLRCRPSFDSVDTMWKFRVMNKKTIAATAMLGVVSAGAAVAQNNRFDAEAILT
jgi:hypothetical protein